MSRLLLAILGLGLAGCSAPRQTAGQIQTNEVIWIASADNGDKPGVGIRLVDKPGAISGTFYLLDPNKPHDFAAGHPVPMEISHTSGTEIQFSVPLEAKRPRRMILKLETPLKGRKVKALLRETSEEAGSVALVFVRQENQWGQNNQFL